MQSSNEYCTVYVALVFNCDYKQSSKTCIRFKLNRPYLKKKTEPVYFWLIFCQIAFLYARWYILVMQNKLRTRLAGRFINIIMCQVLSKSGDNHFLTAKVVTRLKQRAKLICWYSCKIHNGVFYMNISLNFSKNDASLSSVGTEVHWVVDHHGNLISNNFEITRSKVKVSTCMTLTDINCI